MPARSVDGRQRWRIWLCPEDQDPGRTLRCHTELFDTELFGAVWLPPYRRFLRTEKFRMGHLLFKFTRFLDTELFDTELLLGPNL